MADDNSSRDFRDQNQVQEDDDEEGDVIPEILLEDFKDLNEGKETPIRKVAEKIEYPLTDEDRKDLVMLAMRFEEDEYMTGLSLPQLGINKRAFIFEVRKGLRPEKTQEEEVEKDESDKKDITDEVDVFLPEKKDEDVLFPKTLFINPSYKVPKDATLDEDYEICRSLQCENDVCVGPVFRFNRIIYRAYDGQGKIYEGIAEGSVARVIQHEVDHLDGKLYIDYVQQERVRPLKVLQNQISNGEAEELQKGLIPEFPE